MQDIINAKSAIIIYYNFKILFHIKEKPYFVQ